MINSKELKDSYLILSDSELIDKIKRLKELEKESRQIRKLLKRVYVHLPSKFLFPELKEFYKL